MSKKVRRLNKNEVVRDLSEAVDYFNRHGIGRNIKFRVTLLLDTKEEMDLFKRLKFNIGGGSYTDMKGTVVVDLDENMIGMTLGKILVLMLAKAYHEVGHIKYTNSEVWDQFIEEFGERFSTNYGVSKETAKYFGKHIINLVEDGREECCMTKEHSVTRTPLYALRSWWWDVNETPAYSDEHPEQELSDGLFCLGTLASIGWMPKNFANAYVEKPELYDLFWSLKPLINQYVTTEPHADAMPYLWEIIDILDPWIGEWLKRYPNLDDLKKALDKLMPEDGDTSHGTPTSGTSTSGSSEESTGTPSPMHDYFKNDDNSDEGGKINKPSTGTEIEADESMDSIVKRAMKEMDDMIDDEDFDHLVHEGFDDLKNKDRDDSMDNSDLTKSEAAEVEKFYEDLSPSQRDGDWAIRLKYHHSKDKIQPTPEKIKLAGKPLNTAFKRILINKNSAMIQDRKSGSLNPHKLYRIVMDDTRLFSKRVVPQDTDFVFYVLIDGSGSMGHEKYVYAYEAGAKLEEGLKGLVPLKIAQFDCDEYVHHRVVKDFNQESTHGNYCWTYCSHHSSECCNMDGYNIRIAIKELEKRPERNKVLIILSDGQPSGYSNYYGKYAMFDVKQAVRSGRKAGIKIFNIMFGSEFDRRSMADDFKYMYERGIVNVAPEDIGKELLKIAKTELF